MVQSVCVSIRRRWNVSKLQSKMAYNTMRSWNQRFGVCSEMGIWTLQPQASIHTSWDVTWSYFKISEWMSSQQWTNVSCMDHMYSFQFVVSMWCVFIPGRPMTRLRIICSAISLHQRHPHHHGETHDWTLNRIWTKYEITHTIGCLSSIPKPWVTNKFFLLEFRCTLICINRLKPNWFELKKYPPLRFVSDSRPEAEGRISGDQACDEHGVWFKIALWIFSL